MRNPSTTFVLADFHCGAPQSSPILPRGTPSRPTLLVALVIVFPFASSLPLACSVASGSGPSPADQRHYPDSINGCAPATLLNFLKFSGPEYQPALRTLVGGNDAVRMRYLVDRYFRHRPSQGDRSRMRWGLHGIGCEDFSAGISELFADNGLRAPASSYLDRLERESELAHLERVHAMMQDSLAAQSPPILNLRSFVVKRRARHGEEPRWEAAVSHYVLVLGLTEAPSKTGFEVEVLDPWKARRSVIYLHREANGRSFLAQKGGDQNGPWLEGHPFLQVLAPELPTLRPADLDWSDRYLVVAHYLIGRF